MLLSYVCIKTKVSLSHTLLLTLKLYIKVARIVICKLYNIDPWLLLDIYICILSICTEYENNNTIYNFIKLIYQNTYNLTMNLPLATDQHISKTWSNVKFLTQLRNNTLKHIISGNEWNMSVKHV